MFEDFDIEIMADKSMTKQELLNVLEEFYTPEKQKTYGVLGIRIEKMYLHGTQLSRIKKYI